MRVLVSTFADGDDEKVILAMRELPFDQLVLIGEEDAEERDSFDRIRKLEELSGHEVQFRAIEADQFMTMVDSVSDVLHALSNEDVALNISGGSKILGDAALLAAFRLGIESYHCDRVCVKLPVLKGATAMDRFTKPQIRMLDILAEGERGLPELIDAMQPDSKASAERTLRELKKMGIIESRVEDNKILLGLTPEGKEVARASRFARGR